MRGHGTDLSQARSLPDTSEACHRVLCELSGHCGEAVGSKRHGSKPVHGRHAGRTGDTPHRTLSNGHAQDILTVFDAPYEQHEEAEV
jgi:hypothetical protein